MSPSNQRRPARQSGLLRLSRWALLLLCAACGMATTGCAALRQKSAVSDAVAECRRFSREGVSAMERGDWRQAESCLRHAAQASPTDVDARRHLAETLWTRGERHEATEHMRRAVESQPGNPELVVRYGEMLLASGEVEQAMGQAQRGLKLNPRLASAWALRGRAHHQLGQGQRALGDLHQSLLENPTARDVLADVAKIYQQSGRRRRELTTLHKLCDTYVPGEEPTQLLAQEASAYLALGQPSQAVDRLQLACHRGPSAPLLCQLAEAEAATGNATRALATAQLALSADANHLPAQQLVARLDRPAPTPAAGPVLR